MTVAKEAHSPNRTGILGRDLALRDVDRLRSADLTEPHIERPATVGQKDHPFPFGNRRICFFAFEVRDPLGPGAGQWVPPEVIGTPELPDNGQPDNGKNANGGDDDAPAIRSS